MNPFFHHRFAHLTRPRSSSIPSKPRQFVSWAGQVLGGVLLFLLSGLAVLLPVVLGGLMLYQGVVHSRLGQLLAGLLLLLTCATLLRSLYKNKKP